MATIAFATIVDADHRSRELWTAILGRDKHAQDITEYAYSRTVNEDTGDVAIVVPERDAMLDTLIRADQLTADELAALVSLYPDWSSSATYAVDDLAAYSGSLYKCVQAHTAQSDWAPTATPALWTHAAPDNVIPEWQQPTGAHDAYNTGDQVTHNGSVWESLVDGNVWEPGTAGTESLWTQVTP